MHYIVSHTHPVHTLPLYFFKKNSTRFQSVIYQSVCHRHTDSVEKRTQQFQHANVTTHVPELCSHTSPSSVRHWVQWVSWLFWGSGLLLRIIAPWTDLDFVILIIGFLSVRSPTHINLLGRRSTVLFARGGKFYTRRARVKEVFGTGKMNESPSLLFSGMWHRIVW